MKMDLTELATLAKMGMGGLAGALTALFGGADVWMKALLLVIVVDYLTGVGGAWAKGTLSSKTGAVGILKKVTILCIVALANGLDGALGSGGVLRSVVMGFYVANDALSICENAVALGVPVPKALADKLEQLKGEEER